MIARTFFAPLMIAVSAFAEGCLLESANAQASAAEEFDGAPNNGAPNIILIYADDLGWKDISANGAKYYSTPNIDHLVNQGAWFTQAYANAPNCAPSRASLMTGGYTPRHGIFTVDSAARGESKHRSVVPPDNLTQLDPDSFTLADGLKQAGYTTGIIGKWHLGLVSPKEYGFDVSIAAKEYGTPPSYFAPYRSGSEELEDIEVLEDIAADAVEGEYLTDRLAREAVEFVVKNKERPFFLFLSHYAVHVPHQAKADIEAKYRSDPLANQAFNPTYAAMIEILDQAVGSVLDSLEEHALTENTLVIFSSDNGPFGPTSEAKPLRGSKGMLYEGGIRVPMIWYWPGKIPGGISIDTPVIGTDLFPTLLAFAHGDVSDYGFVDGVNLYPLLISGETLADRFLYWHFPAYLERYEGDSSVVSPWRTGPVSAVRFGVWKLVDFLGSETVELYDLSKDIGETTDVSRQYPEIAVFLLEELERWRSDVKAPMPEGPNPEFDREALAGFTPD